MEKGTNRSTGGGFTIANKTKLHFHFHNPNSAEETANYIARVFIEANQTKIDWMLQEAAEKMEVQNEEDRSLSI